MAGHEVAVGSTASALTSGSLLSSQCPPGLAGGILYFIFPPHVFTYLICIWLKFINTKHSSFLLWTSRVASFLSPLNINCIYDLPHSLSFYSALARS